MADLNFAPNTLYEMDNLPVLRGMNSETVDLIATDPPFNTKRNRAGSAGFYVDNWKWGDTGILPDQWAWNEVHPRWLDEIKDSNPALAEVIEATRICHGRGHGGFPVLPQRPSPGDAPHTQVCGEHLSSLRPYCQRLHPHGDGRHIRQAQLYS